jgi:glutathione S-transferase
MRFQQAWKTDGPAAPASPHAHLALKAHLQNREARVLVVHHLGRSQSERIVWLVEELGIPYTFKRYERDPATQMAPAEYKALHPLGTAPIIQDGPVTLAETQAIFEWIVAKYGDGGLTIPASDPAFADYLFWLHFAQGSQMPAEMVSLIVGMVAGDKPEARGMLDGRALNGLKILNARLGEKPYLAGDKFTLADIANMFALTSMRRFAGRDMSVYPNILPYVQKLAARPAFKRAWAKCEPDLEPYIT